MATDPIIYISDSMGREDTYEDIVSDAESLGYTDFDLYMQDYGYIVKTNDSANAGTNVGSTNTGSQFGDGLSEPIKISDYHVTIDDLKMGSEEDINQIGRASCRERV